MKWYIGCWEKYCEFSGRARRQEYWMFVLFNIIATLIVGLVAELLGVRTLSSVYSLAVFLPSLAVTTRRLHDTNRSGWMQLINLVPVVGWAIMLVFLCQDSTPGDNRFGLNPKGM